MPKIILLNKPFNVLCQFTDDRGRTTLADFIQQPGVYAAGRLDYDSEGLVVLTGDGRLQAHISHPRHKMAKVYWVQVEGVPDAAALQTLREGIHLTDGPTLPAQVDLMPEPDISPRDPPVRFRKTIPTSWLQIAITEGRNRQVRRMTAAAGFPTLRLVRYAVGEWNLSGLAPGQWRALEITGPPANRRPRPHNKRSLRPARVPMVKTRTE